MLARPLVPSLALNSITAGGGTGRSNENSRTLSLVLEVIRTKGYAAARVEDIAPAHAAASTITQFLTIRTFAYERSAAPNW